MHIWIFFRHFIFLTLHVILYGKSYQYPNERTAVLISGEIRSGNIALINLRDNNYQISRILIANNRMFSDTPIMTAITNMITPLANHGGVDLFLNIVAYPRSVQGLFSSNNPGVAPVVHPGDTRVCELFSNHPIFGKDTDNNVFCKVSVPTSKSNIFIRQNPIWDTYCFGHVGIEVFLQQEYGKYEANLAAKEYALAKGIKYKYKVRARFDLAYLSTFPAISKFLFSNKNCSSIVYYPNRKIFGFGTEDSFNFGMTEAMDPILDRYIDLITGPVHSFNQSLEEAWWNSEAHLLKSMSMKEKICMVPHHELVVAKMRTKDHQHSFQTHLRSEDNWIHMNHQQDEIMTMFNPSIHMKNTTCLAPGEEESIANKTKQLDLRTV